jgi:hypothetical protein
MLGSLAVSPCLNAVVQDCRCVTVLVLCACAVAGRSCGITLESPLKVLQQLLPGWLPVRDVNRSGCLRGRFCPFVIPRSCIMLQLATTSMTGLASRSARLGPITAQTVLASVVSPT